MSVYLPSTPSYSPRTPELSQLDHKCTYVEIDANVPITLTVLDGSDFQVAPIGAKNEHKVFIRVEFIEQYKKETNFFKYVDSALTKRAIIFQIRCCCLMGCQVAGG